MLQTHYDDLQVVRNASPEVIKGAYKYLAQKWHPDKNPDNCAKAEGMLKTINRAYEVLSIPRLRKEYDDWIARQEAAEAEATSASTESTRDDTSSMGEWIGPARAEWVKFVIDKDGDTHYYDPATMEKRGSSVRVWVLCDYEERDKQGALSYLHLFEYDCKEERARILGGTAYSGQMASGRILQPLDAATKWKDILPDTTGEAMLEILLAHQEAEEARPAAEREQARTAAHETPLDKFVPGVSRTVSKSSLGASKKTASVVLWAVYMIVAFILGMGVLLWLGLSQMWTFICFLVLFVVTLKFGTAVTRGDSSAWLTAPMYAFGSLLLLLFGTYVFLS